MLKQFSNKSTEQNPTASPKIVKSEAKIKGIGGINKQSLTTNGNGKSKELADIVNMLKNKYNRNINVKIRDSKWKNNWFEFLYFYLFYKVSPNFSDLWRFHIISWSIIIICDASRIKLPKEVYHGSKQKAEMGKRTKSYKKPDSWKRFTQF